MSSVGSSDSSGSSNSAAEVGRKNRETTAHSTNNNNESELVKKHQREIRKLTEDHYAQMEGLKQTFTEKLSEIRKSSHDTVSEHDHKYQKEIEDLRGLYRKQLQDQADEAQRRETTIVTAKDNDSASFKKRAENQIAQVRETFQKDLTKNANVTSTSIDQAREEQAATIQKNRENLIRHHEAERQALQESQQGRFSDLQNNYADYRQTTRSQMKEQELRKMEGQKRQSAQLMKAVQSERLNATDQQEHLREGFKDGLKQARESYLDAGLKSRSNVEIAREEFRDSVTGRMNNQVARLEDENQELKEGSNRSQIKSKQQQQREMANLADSYQKNIDNYKEQRDRAVAIGTERVHKSVKEVRQDLTKQMTDVARFYKIKGDELNQINRGAIMGLKGEYEGRVEQSKDNMENRVKNLLDTRITEQQRDTQMQEEYVQSTQKNHQDEIRAVRYKLEDEKQVAVTNLLDRLQKQEVKHNENMTTVVNKYEKQLQSVKDMLVKEKKSSEENLRRTTEEMQRAYKLSVDQMEMQNRDRLRMVDSRHNEQLRTLNKRNDEKIDQVITQVKKS